MSALAGVFLAVGVAIGVAAAAIFALGDRTTLTPPPEAVVENLVRALAAGRYGPARGHLDAALAARTENAELGRIWTGWEGRHCAPRDVRGEPIERRARHASSVAVVTCVDGTRYRLVFPLAWSAGNWAVEELGGLERTAVALPLRR